MILSFPDLATLHWALTSGAVPRDVADRPATTGRTGDVVWVSTDEVIPETNLQLLTALGVVQNVVAPANGRRVKGWLHIFRPTRSRHEPEVRANTPVLFEFADEASWSAAVRELLRLGNDRIE